MNHKKIISLIIIFNVILLGCSIYVWNWSSDLIYSCQSYYLSPTSYPLSYHPSCPYVIFFNLSGLLFLSVILSLLPFFFLKKNIINVWSRFAVAYLSVVVIFIKFAPNHAAFISLGYDREVAPIIFAVLFLIISWSIGLFYFLKRK